MNVTRFSCFICMLMVVLIAACHETEHKTQAESDNNLAADTVEAYPLFDWYQLTPPNWDAMALLEGIDLSNMEDDDPRAFELLKDVRKQWNNAPVNQTLDGKLVTINGYLVPLDGNLDHVKSFLLVPYFGACIHSPPPPSNQIVYVQVSGNGLSLSNWDAFVSVSGLLNIERVDSEFGVAGYRMQAKTIKSIAEAIL